jgi:hypothetical protein
MSLSELDLVSSSSSSSSTPSLASYPLYTKSILSKEVEVKMTELNDLFLDDVIGTELDQYEAQLHSHVVSKIKKTVEGKCVEDGYVKKDSVTLLSLSCGTY